MSKKNKKNNKVVTPPVVETKQEKSEVKDTNVQVDNEQNAEQNADTKVETPMVPLSSICRSCRVLLCRQTASILIIR